MSRPVIARNVHGYNEKNCEMQHIYITKVTKGIHYYAFQIQKVDRLPINVL